MLPVTKILVDTKLHGVFTELLCACWTLVWSLNYRWVEHK